MKLYDYELSGNCYKVRLLLHLLGVQYEKVAVNFHPGREHKADWFVDGVNPLGQIPVLDDAGFLLRDAQAILVYLASRYETTRTWYPDDAQQRGQIQLWLATAEEITRTASAARLHDALGYAYDIEACRRGAHAVFRMLDDHLTDRTTERAAVHASQPALARATEPPGSTPCWLVTDHPTIADIACFPYVALAPEGGISLDEYPALRRWVWDFRHQRGFVGMAGIAPPQLNT